MQLQARDKRALILGAIVVTLLLAFLLWPSGDANESSVDLVPAEQRQAAAAPPASAPALPPQPVPAPAPQPAQPQPAPTGPIPEGLRLAGVTGGGAIFAFPDGTQRLVPRGRDVAPGVTLQAVRLREVILAVGPASYRLGFGGAALPVQPPAAAAPAPLVTPAPAAPPVPAPVPNANLAR